MVILWHFRCKWARPCACLLAAGTIYTHVFRRKKSYYHIDEVLVKQPKSRRKPFALAVAAVLFLTGSYLFVLLQSPDVLISPAVAAGYTEDSLIKADENFIKIERINLLVPFHTGNDEKTLED